MTTVAKPALLEPTSEWHEVRRRNRESETQAADRRARLWNEMLRIEKHLPRLHEQRDEAARRLAEITDLIADEEEAVRTIRASVT